MLFNGQPPPFDQFLEVLSFKLLDMATCRAGDILLTIEEYEDFIRTHDLSNLAGVRIIEDAFAGAYQEVNWQQPRGWKHYNDVRAWFCLPPKEDR